MKQIILQEIALSDNLANENTFDIHYDFDKNQFHAIENVEKGTPREFIYELTDTEENITKNHRQEILEYCICLSKKEDSVGLGDIFVHGKYIKLLKK
jgi:hypothetical protein